MLTYDMLKVPWDIEFIFNWRLDVPEKESLGKAYPTGWGSNSQFFFFTLRVGLPNAYCRNK